MTTKKQKTRLTETECGVHSPLPDPSSLTPLYGCELYLNVGTVQDTLAFRGGYTVHTATSHFNSRRGDPLPRMWPLIWNAIKLRYNNATGMTALLHHNYNQYNKKQGFIT